MLHEATGEVIEKFGVRGGFAEVAEFAGGIDQAATEVVLPDAIDDDASGEGCGVFDDGLCEFQATAAGGEFAWQAGLGREHGEETTWHGGTEVVGIATLHELEIAGHAHLVVELGAVLFFLVHDEERGLFDGVGHGHVEMRGAGLELGDF